MNDLEREVRDALLRHRGDAPSFDTSEAPRVAGRAHRRQVRNVVVGGIAGSATVIVAFAWLGGLVRADRFPIVLNPPSPSPTCAAAAGPDDAEVHGWPDTNRNPAGVYSWDGPPDYDPFRIEGFMHNGYGPGSSDVNILFEGEPGQLVPHRGQTAVTVAGCEGTYRRFFRDEPSGFEGPSEEWMVNIQGTTITILIIEEPKAREIELAEAREIVESIRAEPHDNALGFRLIFTLKTNTWDSG